ADPHVGRKRPLSLDSFPMVLAAGCFCLFLVHEMAPTEISTLSLHDALPISRSASRQTMRHPRAHRRRPGPPPRSVRRAGPSSIRSEEHTSELQSRRELVCRLLLEKKKPEIEMPAQPMPSALRHGGGAPWPVQ